MTVHDRPKYARLGARGNGHRHDCSWHELRRSTAKPSGRSTLMDQCGRGLRAAHGTAAQEARAAPTHVQTRLSTRRRAASFYLALRLSRSLARPAPTGGLRLSAWVKHRSRRLWCKRRAVTLHEKRHAALHVHGLFHVHHVHNGCALPITAETATGPKYRLSNDAGLVALSRNSSPS